MSITVSTFSSVFHPSQWPQAAGTFTLGSEAHCDICLALVDIAPVHLHLVVDSHRLELIDMSGTGFTLNGQRQSMIVLALIPGAVHQLQLGRHHLRLLATTNGWQLHQTQPHTKPVWLSAVLLMLGLALALSWFWLKPQLQFQANSFLDKPQPEAVQAVDQDSLPAGKETHVNGALLLVINPVIGYSQSYPDILAAEAIAFEAKPVEVNAPVTLETLQARENTTISVYQSHRNMLASHARLCRPAYLGANRWPSLFCL